LSEGLATTKSDIYAFGVVLFEIISGKEAIIRPEGTTTKNPERRSLASIVSSAYNMLFLITVLLNVVLPGFTLKIFKV